MRSTLRASVPHGLSDDEHERLLERRGKLQFAALAVGAVITGAAFIGFLVWLGAWLNDHWGIYTVLPHAKPSRS
ncbi:hypothetical protein [Streptomyces sp. NPDC051214]|uniref:hypothetical protein n=1 Tax=Streptomyces sp. NPDC051214 TaxID=3155282 RepID=UPI003430BFB8